MMKNKEYDKNSIYTFKEEILKKIKNNDFSNLTIAIKSPNPINNKKWGDYFFALSLKKAFEKKGFNVVIHEDGKWYSNNDEEDITIVLRGLKEYKPYFKHINIMWNISHPDMISKEEYESYDAVFIASEKYANEMDKELNTIVKPLLQCTDEEIFYPKPTEDLKTDILFVGNTRGVYRQIIKDVLTTNHEIDIYGPGWDNFIDEKYIKGEFIENKDLNKYYSSCKILLNDHWKDMVEKDFPSNRLFDALGCGTFIISDNLKSIKNIFKDSIITYDGTEDLDNKINYYLNNDSEREKIAKKGQEIVLNNHTFNNRADEIIKTLKNLNINYNILNKQNIKGNLYDESFTKSLMLKYITSRIDIKNFGDENNSIEIIDITDSTNIQVPNWFKDKKGEGMQIESQNGTLNMKFKCIQNGTLNIYLRGHDVRDKEGNRFPVYIDYTSLKINEKEQLTENKLTWHDEPYTIKKEVKDNELITLQTKWKPFTSSSLYENKKLKNLERKVEKLTEKNTKQKEKIKELKSENKKMKRKLKEI